MMHMQYVHKSKGCVGVTLRINEMVHCLCLYCQYWLQVVPWWTIGILKLLLGADFVVYRMTCIPQAVSSWNYLGDSVFDGVGLAGFKSRVNTYFVGLSWSLPFRHPLIFLSLPSFCGLALWDWGPLSPTFQCRCLNNNNNNNINLIIIIINSN